MRWIVCLSVCLSVHVCKVCVKLVFTFAFAFLFVFKLGFGFESIFVCMYPVEFARDSTKSFVICAMSMFVSVFIGGKV